MPISEREQFTNKLESEKDLNPLITPKHDPNSTGTFSAKPRTILTQYASGSVMNIVRSPDYNIHQFEDQNYGGAIISVAVPKNPVSAPLLGHPSGSCRFPTASFNCLALPSGSVNSGYHAYAECIEMINHYKVNGRWINEKILSEEPPADDQ